MTYDKMKFDDVEPVNRSMYFLRDALGCENLGVTVIDAKPGWEGKKHNHADEDHEEVYLLWEGEARMSVDGEEFRMEKGDVVRVDPESDRKLEVPEEHSIIWVVGAP